MMSKSEDIVHVYDGIEEADNILPRWWLFTLYGAIVFAIFYWFSYQVLHATSSPLESYRIEKAQVARADAERLKNEGPFTPEKLQAMAKNGAILAAGKTTFQATCAACHGQNAGGMVGPNLTDGFWLHGSKPAQIITTIRAGFPDKGMPAWGPQLGEDRVREVAAFVLSLRGTNVAGGKSPQGAPEGS